MNYPSINTNSDSTSDFSDVSQATAELRAHATGAVSDATNQAKAVKAAAVEKAQDFRSYAGEKAASIKGEATVKLKQGAQKAKALHSNAEDYVRENPTKSVLGAVGLGVIIGLILRR